MTMPPAPRPQDARRETPRMTPERWRAVDAVLQAALACEPARRDAVVAEACGEDDALRREVESLLAAHDRADDGFLEKPAAEVHGAPGVPRPLAERLATALAGRYAVEGELARGGMATVHLARDLRHDRRVAIKVLREELAAALGAQRFLDEIRITASLQHAHILPLFDSGSAEFPPEAGGWLLWYVMPYVEGETLRSRLTREGRLPVDVALQLAREMADALEYAHRHGVVHRDVKPENVLLQDGHALVADFGIALALQQAGGERLTRTGIMVGTPQYMAPEQAAGERAIDARADVYALGAVLHEMLTGEPPFPGVVQRATSEPVPALTTLRPDVPPVVDAAVRRALAKSPEDRFASAGEFASALGARAPSAESRKVSARAALYAAGAMLAIGLGGGWVLAGGLSVMGGWMSAVSALFTRPSEDDAAWGAATDGGELTLTVVDRAGRPRRTIAANRPWTPRFSPDGSRVAYGAFGPGRSTSDLWVTDLDAGTTLRVTDDDGDSNDPQWSADGLTLAYSGAAPGGKDVMTRPVDEGEPTVLAARDGTQFPSDWLRDGSALLVTEHAGPGRNDILVQRTDGSGAWPYAATPANENGARVSPDGRWVAYTSDESGRGEVYLDSYPRPGRRVMISSGGGIDPVWRGDGRELYYWSDGALVAVRLATSSGGAPPGVGPRTVLFRAPYFVGANTMYDVSPDGEQFVIVRSRGGAW